MKFLKKIFNNSNTKIFLQLIGVFLVLLFVWFRFFKQKIPRDIPFQLSIISFCVLLCICLVYLYMTYRIFIPSSHKIIIEVIRPVLTILFKPLLLFNDFLLTNTTSKNALRFSMKLFARILVLRKRPRDNLLLYSFFFIMPKFILALCLMIDCIYNKQLYLFYWCVIVISLPLIIKYLLSYKNQINDIFFLENHYIIEITSEDLVYNEEDYDEEGFLKSHLPRRFWNIEDMEFDIEYDSIRYKYMKLNKFIEYQSAEFVSFYVPHEYRLLSQSERKDIIFLSEKSLQHGTISKEHCESLLLLSLDMEIIREEIDLTQKYYFNKKYNFNALTFLTNSINIALFLCWGYILIKSLHTLPNDSFNWLHILIPKYANPFI